MKQLKPLALHLSGWEGRFQGCGHLEWLMFPTNSQNATTTGKDVDGLHRPGEFAHY